MKRPPFTDADVQHFFDVDYHDRGLMKWQGYFLSDHTSAIKEAQSDNQWKTQPLPRQSQPEIKRRLVQAVHKQRPVLVQQLSIDGQTNAHNFATGIVD
ncbi:hypothetical protein [Levilactobacillus bambusae]|uniref:DNA-directed RNA polymerase beta subunit n=1 Tax=Levilactobacillus bambusae TaxID=2024736 RepID=A0A2V1MZC7_9LACO|nr:hypothetical protein [Levilactobacillus bambusae]PWG00329.1 hypothetical protein DCM90_05205 [Levilactobacillus bambusae]